MTNSPEKSFPVTNLTLGSYDLIPFDGVSIQEFKEMSCNYLTCKPCEMFSPDIYNLWAVCGHFRDKEDTQPLRVFKIKPDALAFLKHLLIKHPYLRNYQ